MKHTITTFLLSLLLLDQALIPARALAEHGGEVQQALALHDRGVQLFQQNRYREAVQAFEQAERLAHNPLNLWNMSRCYQELGEHQSALSMLDRYIAEPALSPSDRAAAARRRQEILAARPATPSPAPGEPVPVSVRLQEDGAPPSRDGEESNLTVPWVVLGSGLGLLLVGGVLDLVAFLQSGRDGNDQFGSYDEYQDWHGGVMNIAIAGDVLVGVGAAVAVGGLVWLLVARSRRSSNRATESPLSVAVGTDGLMLNTRLRF